MKRSLVVGVVLLLVATFALGACGKKTNSDGTQSIRAPKTKFVIHAGLGFGAFHRYIYKPIKNQSFQGASRIRKALIITKGLAAAAFVYHELKLAIADAQASPLLSKFIAPFTAAAAAIKALPDKLRSGDTSTVDSANVQITDAQQQSNVPDRNTDTLKAA